MQAVFALQVTQNLHRAPGFEIVREFAALLIDPQRHDMEMLSVDILMFEGNVRLVANPYAPYIREQSPEVVRQSVCLPVMDSARHGKPY